MLKIEEYREVAPPGAVDMALRLAERLRGRRFLHVSGGRLGTGPAEILRAALPILTDMGVETGWEITGGDPSYYATARALSAALEGAERTLRPEALAHWVEMNRLSGRKLTLDADLVLVHDVPPASLVEARKAGRWVWRCHLDCSRPEHRAWLFFREFVERYDAVVVSLPGYGPGVAIPQYVIQPSIDPLSDKNRGLPASEIATILHGLGVARDKPLLVQVGALARSADLTGLVNSYRLVKRHHDVRLVLAGTTRGGPDRAEARASLEEATARDPDIVVVELPPEAHRQINALQRAATIVLQTEESEGFELGAAEAMWKGKPVIGRATTEALRQLIIPDVTGYLVRSVEGAAFRMRQLLNNPELIPRMGAAGREHVRRAFLITRHLVDYLALMIHLGR
ncbi:MAG: glycosyltransferase [Candidatus Rokubacteria bacterium]|nr:glycosyltransferase [Candidatus Rokubacteria bacterium]